MKRIICLTMALVMTFACVSAFAAQYDGLPEKMMLQMELSGLKGSVTLSATGNPELEALLDETENEYCAELSDDDLVQVSAAGEAKRIKRRGTDGDGAV